MIIDFVQNRDSVELSYVNEKGGIDVTELPMESGSVTRGFFRIIETTPDDHEAIPELKSFYNSPVKKEPAAYFKDLNQNEFLNYAIRERDPELYEKLNMLREPRPYSIDIETEITDEYGYSTAEKAENKIISISVTNDKLKTILFIVRNPKYKLVDGKELSGDDEAYIRSILSDSLEKFYHYAGDRRNEDLPFIIKEFDSETEMLISFIASVNKYFHLIIGWNIYDYDLKYIFNRCRMLGLDVKKMSPVNAMAPVKKSVNISLEVPIEYPTHRMAVDYMNIFKGSELYRTLDNFSLNNCSEVVLGLHKVSYDGNLRTLYETDYLRFVAYALVDTILVMLLDIETRLMSTYFFQSYYNSVPYMKLNQNPISLALVYRELRNKGKFICESEYPEKVSRAYIGAFVKEPTKHNIAACMGEDFGSLYPSSMISCYLSFDTKVPDKIIMDEFGHPINKAQQEKFDRYKAEGCCITPMGRIYKADGVNVYTSCEKNLLAERKVFKKAKEDIYLNIIPSIEKEIKRRKSLQN